VADSDRFFLRIGARPRLCRCASRTWNQLGAIQDCCAARRLQSWCGGWSALCRSHRTSDSVESQKKSAICAPMGSRLFSRCRLSRQLLDGGTNYAKVTQHTDCHLCMKIVELCDSRTGACRSSFHRAQAGAHFRTVEKGDRNE
jgi:hypothetical protein